MMNYDIHVMNLYQLLYSGNHQLMYGLFILMFVDIVTGVLKAFYLDELWSRRAMLGYIKKIAYICVLIVTNLIDIIFHLNGLLINSSVMFFILGEATSILENAIALDVPVPESVKQRLNVQAKKGER
ncbi:toxin secretion/phage lysis holin [Staphylococcus auricularis]|uniref:Holin n=1 Tax=Staphylococcus auricularis TaxID=29379 RepID=A0AAP8TTN7_9STAP|nr:phage holin family protein [Staphylococcus auricularis]MBM0868836.1 holin [Staphylococcus auricularis]MCG7341449.1 phage holin family protein [Staphylococcus auricularis]MDC6326338.1 phage holin family protein [Staphylococcus auricularis]MDN4533773.1 phage holin family protein [Staphylococcus auricularis]PNZ68674.1 holin [Staphylococcus auricularis]